MDLNLIFSFPIPKGHGSALCWRIICLSNQLLSAMQQWPYRMQRALDSNLAWGLTSLAHGRHQGTRLDFSLQAPACSDPTGYITLRLSNLLSVTSCHWIALWFVQNHPMKINIRDFLDYYQGGHLVCFTNRSEQVSICITLLGKDMHVMEDSYRHNIPPSTEAVRRRLVKCK